jgi:hypothetical protein
MAHVSRFNSKRLRRTESTFSTAPAMSDKLAAGKPTGQLSLLARSASSWWGETPGEPLSV